MFRLSLPSGVKSGTGWLAGGSAFTQITLSAPATRTAEGTVARFGSMWLYVPQSQLSHNSTISHSSIRTSLLSNTMDDGNPNDKDERRPVRHSIGSKGSASGTFKILRDDEGKEYRYEVRGDGTRDTYPLFAARDPDAMSESGSTGSKHRRRGTSDGRSNSATRRRVEPPACAMKVTTTTYHEMVDLSYDEDVPSDVTRGDLRDTSNLTMDSIDDGIKCEDIEDEKTANELFDMISLGVED